MADVIFIKAEFKVRKIRQLKSEKSESSSSSSFLLKRVRVKQ